MIQGDLEFSITHGEDHVPDANQDKINPFLELLRIYLVKDGTTDEAMDEAFQQGKHMY